MLKKLSLVILIFGLFGMPLLFSSCCGDEQCSEEDTYGKAIFKKTDTVYKRNPKIKISPMSVQIGAFANRNNADYFTKEARERLKVDIFVKVTPEGIYRILIGEYTDMEAAREMLMKARQGGYDDAFIRDEFGAVER